MFAITHGQGFRMTLGNGWTASVQFGLMNYCDNKLKVEVMLTGNLDPIDWNAPMKDDFWESGTAEIAAWYGEREEHMGMTNWYDFGNDQVKGWCSPDEVVKFLGMVSKLPSRRLTSDDYVSSEVVVAPI